MFGLSNVVLFPLLVLIPLLAFEWRRLKVKCPLLVLREFRIGVPDAGGQIIVIRGRPAGIVAALCSLFSSENTTSLVVTDHEIKVETAGLHGISSEYVPLHNVASSDCAYFRAFYALVAAFLVYAMGGIMFLVTFYSTSASDYDRQSDLGNLDALLWTTIVVGTAFYLVYALSKRILIAIETSGGKLIGVAFKRSVVDNVPLELDQARQAVALLNNRLLLTHEGPQAVVAAAGGN